MQSYFLSREMPEGLEGLIDLALDLRWTWSHFSDRLWQFLDPEAWERTGNPYFILQSVSQERLEEIARDPGFREELRGWLDQRQRYATDPGWFGNHPSYPSLKGIAYFSMEFGLSEALPIYSGGLGILAGDYLKAASDLNVPVTGIGLLYQQGYFRQVMSSGGWQLEAYPYNDPVNLPVMPVRNHGGGWLRLHLDLPGRLLLVRVWQALVGRVTLYLLDTNDPLNSPADRGITTHLYPSDVRQRLMQEIVLGIGGWFLMEELGLTVDVCHLNEGHSAFAVLARALTFMRQTGTSFPVALRATRAGNVFTTHTPVEAAFDRFSRDLIRPYAENLSGRLQVPIEDLLALGRRDPRDRSEPFNMAYLAMHGCGVVTGVSRLHGAVSRRNFQPLFPNWPEVEVPVGYVTNGVHVPSWDSPDADALWTRSCGKGRWAGDPAGLCALIGRVSDAELWNFRASQRLALVQYVRRQLVRQLREHGGSEEQVQRAQHVLDPNILTLGFSRRFVNYKRPTLLLYDRERLIRLLRHPERPLQLLIAGKAHPADGEGKRLLQELAEFAAQPGLDDRVIFLEDYDMVVASRMVAGIDVWINTPRRPWEACGTSGMKVLVNGGLNLSELDGWWEEAYGRDVGWAIGDGKEHDAREWDPVEAGQLLDLLEQDVAPAFYTRDDEGIPRRWVTLVRTSMAKLTPQFSSNRMMQEYVERLYVPAAQAYQARATDGAKVAHELEQWRASVGENWASFRFGEAYVRKQDEMWHFDIQVYLGDLDPDCIHVELYADAAAGDAPARIVMVRNGAVPGSFNMYLYEAVASASRPVGHYTPRIVPYHPAARVPLEDNHIVWKRV